MNSKIVYKDQLFQIFCNFLDNTETNCLFKFQLSKQCECSHKLFFILFFAFNDFIPTFLFTESNFCSKINNLNECSAVEESKRPINGVLVY